MLETDSAAMELNMEFCMVTWIPGFDWTPTSKYIDEATHHLRLLFYRKRPVSDIIPQHNYCFFCKLA